MIPVKMDYLYFDPTEPTGRVPIIRPEIREWFIEHDISVIIEGNIRWHGSTCWIRVNPHEYNGNQYGDIVRERFVFEHPEQEMFFKLTWA